MKDGPRTEIKISILVVDPSHEHSDGVERAN